MTIEEVIDRTVRLQEAIEIEYCTRSGRECVCHITHVHYSDYYGGQYIDAFCTNWGTTCTFKVNRIQKINGHGYNCIAWKAIANEYKDWRY
ncbi:MAG: hypothetical protein IJV36_00340 [Prevotella sp.]|nr:hypothetical protein [Prevotella sp.]